MELKLVQAHCRKCVPALLIVPYGIETCSPGAEVIVEEDF